MKKRKGLLLCGLSVLLGLTAVSCASSGNSSSGNENAGPQLIDMSEDDTSTKRLNSISVSTTNAKTQYELGESFDPTGIVVTANYVEYVDNSPVGTHVDLTSGYYFDYSLVDFHATGKYPVYAYYREATKILSATFNVTVKSTKIVESGKNYVAGIQIETEQYKNGDVDNTNVVVVKKGTTYTTPKFSVKAHNFIGEVEQSVVDLTNDKVVLDESAVDTSKEGIYYVKATYTGEVIDGEVNQVVAFILVNVINPIQSISFVSGEKTLPSTAGSIDTSTWKMSFKKEIGEAEVVNYDDYDFTISGVNSLVAQTYTATITYADPSSVRLIYKEITLISSSYVAGKYYTVDAAGNYNLANGTYSETATYYKKCYGNDKKASFTTTVEVTIVESTTESIYSYMSFGEFLPSDYLDTDTNESVTAAEIIENYSSSRIQILKDRSDNPLAWINVTNTSGVDQHAPADKDTKGTDFDISATCRFKLNGAPTGKTTRNVEVAMPTKGTVVIYFATSSSGTERFLQMFDADFNKVDDQIYGTASYGKAVFSIDEAGTYYFGSSSGGINIYAVIVSYEN